MVLFIISFRNFSAWFGHVSSSSINPQKFWILPSFHKYNLKFHSNNLLLGNRVSGVLDSGSNEDGESQQPPHYDFFGKHLDWREAEQSLPPLPRCQETWPIACVSQDGKLLSGQGPCSILALQDTKLFHSVRGFILKTNKNVILTSCLAILVFTHSTHLCN